MYNNKTNNLFFSYGSTQNVEQFAGAGSIFITGWGNRYSPAFQIAREKGAKVYAYLDIPEVPVSNSLHPIELGFYRNDVNTIPRWGNGRASWENKVLSDIRVGSWYVDWAAEYIGNLGREGLVDGVFLDVVGAQLWSRARWSEWPEAERAEWTNGAVDLVRKIDQNRNGLEVVNNNLWRDDKRGLQYVNGFCLEWPTLGVLAAHVRLVQETYKEPRRVFVIARNDDEARAWANVQGSTHITSVVQGQETYQRATPALFPYTSIFTQELKNSIRPLQDRVEELSEALVIAEMGNDQLRVLLDTERQKLQEIRSIVGTT